MRHTFLKSRLVVLLVANAAVAVVAFRLYQPPEPVPASAHPEVFSAGRAMVHVRDIARAPHPTGSTENARVRDYLVGELRDELGLEVELQPGTVVPGAEGNRAGGPLTLNNVFARLPGSNPGPGILLTAHYDSVRAGPGAADNAVNVAAILEALRTVRTNGTPASSVLVLFTDGEEAGLLGAQVFVRDHLSDNPVRAVFNFDARGSSGPTFMYETSGANASLVAALASSSPLPLATSLGDFVYQKLPNNTDFTIFRHAGIPGMNFAFFDGVEHYHKPSDNPENLSQRSLQHVGGTILGLIEHFAFKDTAHQKAPDTVNTVYFNLLGPILVFYPTWVARAISVILLITLLVFIIRPRRRERCAISPPCKRRLVRAFFVAGATVLAGGILGLIAILLGYRFGNSHAHLAIGFWNVLAVAIAGAIAIQHRIGNSTGPAMVLVLAACITGFVLPEGSYLFQWPALLATAALAFKTDTRIHLLAASTLTATLIQAPTIYYLFTAVPTAAPVLMALATLTATTLPAGSQKHAQ